MSVNHYPRSDVTFRSATTTVCPFCEQTFTGKTTREAERLYKEHEAAMVKLRRQRERSEASS